MAEVLDGSLSAEDNSQLVLIQGGERVRLVRSKLKRESILTSVIKDLIVKDRLGQSVFGDNTLNYAEHRICHGWNRAVSHRYVPLCFADACGWALFYYSGAIATGDSRKPCPTTLAS